MTKCSSLCLIKAGHRLKLRDLLTGMLMCSGNDAAYTVAVNVARDVSGDRSMSDADAVAYFVQLMNDYAIQIGASNSNFTTPDGWDHTQQHTTICDLARIADIFAVSHNFPKLLFKIIHVHHSFIKKEPLS